MKVFLTSILIVLLSACEISNSMEETPALIEIEAIGLSGNHTHQIVDAWVYSDNEFLGVYPLPTSFPVLTTGSQSIIIDAGIKKNGISSSRESYSYFTSYQIDTLLEPNQRIILSPIVNYNINSFPFEENFESVGTTLNVVSDSVNHQIVKVYNNSNSAYGNYFATVEIDGENGEIFECTTDDLNLPKDQTVFLEMDYKCNASLVVGMYANFVSQVNKTSIIYLNPKEDWNKIYISLTEAISNYNNAQSFKLFFGTARDTSLSSNSFSFDNIRLVYEE